MLEGGEQDQEQQEARDRERFVEEGKRAQATVNKLMYEDLLHALNKHLAELGRVPALLLAHPVLQDNAQTVAKLTAAEEEDLLAAGDLKQHLQLLQTGGKAPLPNVAALLAAIQAAQDEAGGGTHLSPEARAALMAYLASQVRAVRACVR